MKLPPAVMVHGLEQARAALAPGLPVTLLSAPSAGSYAGVGWWRALVALAAQGGTVPPDILDCGEACGRALEALRAGQRLLIVRTDPALFGNIVERAVQLGATVLAEAPPALDLGRRGALRELEGWLAKVDIEKAAQR
jgi:hypothetical protein